MRDDQSPQTTPLRTDLEEKYVRKSSVHLEHMFPAVLGIADQLPAPRVYHQVEILQRNLADKHRDVVGI